MTLRSTRCIFKHYFGDLVIFFKICGLWLPAPDASSTIKALYFLYNGFWFCSEYLHVLPSEFVTAVYSDNMVEAIRRLRDFGNHLTLFLKAINWYIWQKELIPLIDTMQNYEVDYEDYESFKPEEIIALHKRDSMKWTKFFGWVITSVLTCIFISLSMVIFLEHEFVIKTALPNSIFLPVRNDTKALHAATAYFMFSQFTLLPYTIVFLDGFFVVTASYMSAQFRIISGALRTIRPRSIQLAIQKGHADIGSIMNQELRKCIRQLNFVYRISATMEEFFTYQVGFQMVLSWTQVCFSLYFASSDDLTNGIGNFSYLMAILLELFIYCAFGDDVTRASEDVREAFYDCHWEETDKKFKQAVQISMIRVTRPVYLTASKLTPLSLQLFLTVIRGGYSLFTLLQRQNRR